MPVFIRAAQPTKAKVIKKGSPKLRAAVNPNESPSRRVVILEERKKRGEGIYRLVKNTDQLTGKTQTAVAFGFTCEDIQRANPYRVMKVLWAAGLKKPFPEGSSLSDALKGEFKGCSPKGFNILVPRDNLDEGIVAIRKIAEYLREL